MNSLRSFVDNAPNFLAAANMRCLRVLTGENDVASGLSADVAAI